MRKLTSFLLPLIASCAFNLNAVEPLDPVETPRPVQSSWMAGVGASSLVDTYLSPIKYSGWSTWLGYERMQRLPLDNARWMLRLQADASLNRALNHVGNAVMWGIDGHSSCGLLRRWTPSNNLTLAAGPAAAVEVGCLYNARNGNNPASAKGAVSLDASGLASWDFNLWRLPVTLTYSVDLPVSGAFFSPAYGELYYEIYLGNHSGLVHPAWWGNRFKFNNMLSANLHLGATSLRLGYRLDYLDSKVNDINTRIVTHQLVVGVTTNWLSVNPHRKGK